MHARTLLVEGRVQGVYFRASTQARARELGLCGWVRNLRDGRVQVHAQGDEDALEALEAWCHDGPEGARVDHLEASDGEPQPALAGFEIRATVAL